LFGTALTYAIIKSETALENEKGAPDLERLNGLIAGNLFLLLVHGVPLQEWIVFFLFHPLVLKLLVACGHVARRWFTFLSGFCAFQDNGISWHCT
jgi:hypothetical protein